MSRIRYSELINQDLLDEKGLRKEPLPKDQLTKREKRCVKKYVDQTFKRVELIDGRKVSLEELRINIDKWFPETRQPRKVKTEIKTPRGEGYVHASTLIWDDTTVDQLTRAYREIMDSKHLPLESFRGDVTDEQVKSDFLFMGLLVELYNISCSIPVHTLRDIFDTYSTSKMGMDKYRHKLFWIRFIYKCRVVVGSPSNIMGSINTMIRLINPANMPKDFLARENIKLYHHYDLYIRNEIRLTGSIGMHEHVNNIASIDKYFLNTPKRVIEKPIDCYYIRLQYLFVNKILLSLRG